MDEYMDKLRCEHCKNVFINTEEIKEERRIQRCPHCLYFLIRGKSKKRQYCWCLKCKKIRRHTFNICDECGSERVTLSFGYFNISEILRKNKKKEVSLPGWIN